MVNNKIIAAIVVVVIALAAVGVYISLDSNEAEKKGLYRLNAVVSDVDMGKCSATPAVIITIEDMYRDYYGDLINDGLTLADAKADKTFWDKYCDWTSIIEPQENGTFNVNINTAAKGSEIKNIPASDAAIVMGTMYSETMYYLICKENDVRPYSDESYNNQNVLDFMQNTILGGMQYSYYEENDVDYILKTVKKSTYHDLGVNSVQTLDSERLTSVLKEVNAKTDGNVIYFASGSRITSAEHYNNNTRPCDVTDSYYAFFAPSQINEVFPAIQCIGLLMGFSEETINELIGEIQLRLYKVYYSVQEKTDGKITNKAYWEGSSGKSINSAMGKVILNFLGFDTSLLDGAEHDLESLIVDKPTYIVFYTNDGRTIDDRMRINN